jgi:N-acetylneuraminic acid mutarotase
MTGPIVWETRPPLNIARAGLVGARAGGQLIVTGGYNSASTTDVLLSVERRDSGGVWTEDQAPMPTPRGNAAAADLDGRIYVIGGYSFGPTNPALHVVEVYDPQPAPGAWTTAAPLPHRLGGIAAARVDARIYAGGGADAGPVENRVWKYDPNPFPGSWSQVQPMNVRRTLFKMARLKGKLYAIGGRNENGVLDVVERYDPHHPADGWEIIKPMQERRANPGVVVVGKRIYVVGGGNGMSPSPTTEMFDLDDGQWHLLTPLLSPARASLVAARQGNEILAIGGFEATAQPGASIASARVDALRIDQPDLLKADSPRLIG